MRSLAPVVLMAMLYVGAAGAQTCEQPPFAETYVNSGTVAWNVGTDSCELSARLDRSDHTAAAVAHFRRRDSAAPLRLRFRVDLSALSNQNSVQSVQLATGVARTAAPAGAHAQALLFGVAVSGNSTGTAHRLLLSAVCNSGTIILCTTSVALTVSRPTIGLEWQRGPAGTGALRWWIDQQFEQPPTGTMALDNQAWAGVERVVLGLSSPDQGFAPAFNGQTVRFDRVEFFDDQVSWDDFELVEAGNCQIEAQPLFVGGLTPSVNGTTCGGGQALPALASGSTHAWGAERIYAVNVLGVGFNQDPRPLTLTIPTSQVWTSAFFCERTCGLTSRCLTATSSGSGESQQVTVPAGQYLLVVKSNLPSACGSFSVAFHTVLK